MTDMTDNAFHLGVGVLIGLLFGIAIDKAINSEPPNDKATLAGLQAQATAMSNIIWQSDKIRVSMVSDWFEVNKRAAELAKKIELQGKP